MQTSKCPIHQSPKSVSSCDKIARKWRFFIFFAISTLLTATLSAESYAFRLTPWKDSADHYRLEIWEFDIQTPAEFNQLTAAFSADPNLIRICTTFKEAMDNLTQKSVRLHDRDYHYFPCAIIVNTTQPFLISTKNTNQKCNFTFNGTLAKVSENEFKIDYTYEKFRTGAFVIQKKQAIQLNKVYFIASSWDLPKK